MKVERAEDINRLIAELKVNDSKSAGEYHEIPKEPEVAIEELVKLGEIAIDSLIELLRGRSKFSCLYAIKILGEIRDPRAVEPILDVLSSDEFNDNFQSVIEHDQPIIALHKIGMPALESTLLYLKAEMEKGDECGISDALRILAGMKDEKSFTALVEMLSYDHPKFEMGLVKLTAIELLGKYGDRRAVEHLAKLLEDEDVLEDKELREYTAHSIRELISVKEYREIIAPYAPKYLNSHRDEIYQSLRDLEYAHERSPRFEGDDADELNFLVQEFRIGRNVEKLLFSASGIAAFEGLISDKDEERLSSVAEKLREKRWRLENKHEEEKSIIDGYIPGPVLKEEARTYKGIAPERYGDEHPKLDALLTSVHDCVKKQGFRVLKEYSSLYARKGNKSTRKGCYILVAKDDDRHRRSWGLAHLVLWGEAWSTEEAETFTTSFYQHIHNKVSELVEKKKLQIQTLDIQSK